MAGRNRHFKCVKPRCSHLSFVSFKKYVSHVRNYHVHEPNFKIKCPADSCFRSYSLISSLTTHMRRRKHYPEDLNKDKNDDIVLEDECQNVLEDPIPLHSNQETIKCNSHDISEKEIALFALKTQEFNRLSDKATDAILESTFQLIEQKEDHLKAEVKKCFANAGHELKEIEGLEELLEAQHDVTESMKQLKTSKERNKYLRETLNMVVSTRLVTLFVFFGRLFMLLMRAKLARQLQDLASYVIFIHCIISYLMSH